MPYKKPSSSYYSVLMATAVASFITPFTTSSIAIALPIIAEEFKVTLAEVNWVANSFLVALASAVLIAGRVGDWLGRGRIFVIGTAMFVATSLAMLIVNSFEGLLACRFLQGVSAAMISGTAVAVLTDALPKEKRGMGIGINTASVYLGLSLGPLIGGYFTSYLGWRSLFMLKAAISFLSLIVAVKSVDLGRGLFHHPNFLRSMLIASSITMIVYGTSNISSSYGLATAFLGGILLIVTLLMEFKSSKLLHPVILRSRSLAANTAALLNYSATYALTILLSAYLQKIRSLTPSETGLILTTQSVFQAVFSPIAGSLADRYNPSTLASLGMLVITAGVFSLTFIGQGTPTIYLIYALIVLGVGFAFFASPNTTAIMNMSPREAYGSATAFLATMRFLGQALSVSIITSAMILQKDLMTAMRTSLTTYFVLSILGTLLSLLARGSTGY